LRRIIKTTLFRELILPVLECAVNTTEITRQHEQDDSDGSLPLTKALGEYRKKYAPFTGTVFLV
jgi:hypothetical protein